MAASTADDTITLVTSDEPPIVIEVEREKLHDSRIFNDMFSLLQTDDSAARVDVAETAEEVEAWIGFLNSGKLETPRKISDDEELVLGRKAVAIAKLVDKYACTSSRHLLIAELWQVSEDPILILIAG